MSVTVPVTVSTGVPWPSDWSAAVLCGGASRRMGRDKALLGPPERPLAARVRAAIIECGIVDVLLVGGDGDRLRRHGPWVPDDEPGAGPLSALATVQRLRSARPLLVCACDLPGLTGGACRPLVQAVEDGAAVAVPVLDGRPAWSCVALSAAAGRSVAAAVAAGERSMHGGLGGLNPAARLEVSGSVFADVDDPAALAEFTDG